MVNIKRDIFLKYEFRYLNLHLFQYTLFSHPVKHNFLNLIFFKEKRNVTFHTVSLLFFLHPFLAVVLFKRKKHKFQNYIKKKNHASSFLTTQTKRNFILARHIILFFQVEGSGILKVRMKFPSLWNTMLCLVIFCQKNVTPCFFLRCLNCRVRKRWKRAKFP